MKESIAQRHASAARSKQSIVSVSPFRCRLWSLHDRMEEHITEENCRDEIASFSRHGQLVPVLGRSLNNDPMHDYELIFGARRLFVARHVNVPLLVEVREMGDRDGIIAMDIENRQRRDISPYERGLSYARWLREGYFSSQEEIAQALKISASHVSRLLRVARLPPVILGAFEHPSEITEAWALELSSALEDPKRREPTIRAARDLARESVRMPGRDVCRNLLSAGARGRRATARSREEVVLSDTGTPLFRIRNDRSWVTLRLPVAHVSTNLLAEIRSALCTILYQQGRHRVDTNAKLTAQMLAAETNAPTDQLARVL